MTFQIALAHWQLGHQVSLPMAATEALVDGMDSPTLRILAGLQDPNRDEAEPILRAVLTETGLRLPTTEEAAVIIARSIAQRICARQLRPHEGAKEIWELSVDTRTEGRFDAFIYNASVLDDLRMMPATADRDSLIARFETDVIREATSLISSVDA